MPTRQVRRAEGRFGVVVGGNAGVAQHPVFGLRQIGVRVKP